MGRGAVATAIAVAALAACSDSGTGPKRGGAGVTVTPRETRMDVGGTTALEAAVRDADGNVVRGAQIFWASGDTALAEVTAEGVVKAKSPGTVQIAASFAGMSDVATVVIARPAVASVTVSPASQSVTVGGTAQFQATVLGASGQPLAGRTVTWKSSDESIAKVDATGRVTGIAPGAAAITASSESRSASAAVSVSSIPVAGVAVAPGSASLAVGQTTQLTASVTDAAGAPLRDRPIAWSSSDQGVATVSSTGLVVALAPGTATITATSGDRSASSTVAVSPVPVGSVIVSPSPAQLTAGQTVQLNVQVTDANGRVVTDRPVSYSSSDPAVATVSASGLVSGVAPGTATVSAMSDAQTGTTTVIVGDVPVASVTVTPAAAALVVGGTTTLSAAVQDGGGKALSGRPVSWTSSNTSVATVSQSGVVTAVGAGAAFVFATSEGKVGQAQVTVTPVPVADVAVAPPSASVEIGRTVQLVAAVTDPNGNALADRAVSWSSSNPLVALVSGAGLVTGVSAGVATITATAEGKSGSAAVTVRAPAPVPVASVVVSPNPAQVREDGTVVLSAVCLAANGDVLSGRPLTWASGEERLATIQSTSGQSATVRGKRAGTVTVTATCDGTSGSATVRVTR